MPHHEITVWIGANVEETDENERNDVLDVVQMVATNKFHVRIGRCHDSRLVACQGEIFWIGENLRRRERNDEGLTKEYPSSLTSLDRRFIEVSADMLIIFTRDAVE